VPLAIASLHAVIEYGHSVFVVVFAIGYGENLPGIGAILSPPVHGILWGVSNLDESGLGRRFCQ